jgi:beta-lactamase superfamily II metal-dependent hydrolase
LSLCRASGPLTLELFRGDDLEGNEGSRALLLGFGRSRVLLFGDAEGAGLRALLDRNRRLGPVDLLLLPHHGSETLWLAALLRAARPRRIWVSAATDPALARELDRRKLDWTVTSRAGPLSLELGPDRPLKGRLR